MVTGDDTDEIADAFDLFPGDEVGKLLTILMTSILQRHLIFQNTDYRDRNVWTDAKADNVMWMHQGSGNYVNIIFRNKVPD